MITPKFSGIVGGEAIITMTDSGSDAMTSQWCGWSAMRGGDVTANGVFQLAGSSPGAVLRIPVPPGTTGVELQPLRSFTPFPMAYYRHPQLQGRWQVTGKATGCGAGTLGIRVVADADKSYLGYAKLTAPGEFHFDFSASTDWSCLHLLVERPGVDMSIDSVRLVHPATGTQLRLLFESSKPEASGLSGAGDRFIFQAKVVPWSYFTSWPVPI